MKHLCLFLFFIVSVNASASFFYKDLEFLAMENFSVKKKDDKVYIGFDYVIKNPNWYNIIIKPSSLKLTVADTDCGYVEVMEKVVIKKKKKGSYGFVLVGESSNFVKTGFSSIWYLITGKGVDFNIKGKLDAGLVIFNKKWPLDYTYQMTYDEFLSLF